MRIPRRKLLSAVVTAGLLALAAAATALAAGVDPASVSTSLSPGQSFSVTKTVHTPAIPPKVDILFLADTTGSMGGAIGNVQTNAAAILSAVRTAQPDSQFGAAEYRDFNCSDPFAYRLDQAITANLTDAQNGINAWATGDGCDTPEAQLNALGTLATDPATGFRAGATHVVVWFGDASGHDPSGPWTLSTAIAALQAANVMVLAIPVNSGFGDGLDSSGQATAVAAGTGGQVLPAATPDQVANAILAGLSNLPATVTGTPSCDPALSVGLSPASITVTSGQDAVFSETISVAPDAVGGTHTCTVQFSINGTPAGPDFVQSVEVTVPFPDVAIVKTGPANAQAGDNLVYTLTATNNGPSKATGVTISDPVPANSTFVSADPGCSEAAGVVTCAVGDLLAGASASYAVTVQAGNGPSVTNTATVAEDQADTDTSNNSSTITTAINRPPDCTGATIGPDLWPPNHKFSSSMTISGLTDPDGNPISVAIDSIFQDEPTNGLGDGDAGPPDAQISGSSFQVRVERSGLGNGRAYYVNFTASDGAGGSCTGTATVMVPHDQAHAAVGDGQLYNSIP